MSKFSHFLKVLRGHIFMILLIGILCGGIAASYIYYFYNPKNVTYEITFKSNENINLSLDYIVNVKNIIEKERINGEYINEKGEVKYPYSSFSYIDENKVYKSTSITYYDNYAIIRTEKRNFNTWQQARRFLHKIIIISDSNATFKNRDGIFIKDDNAKDILNSTIILNECKKEYIYFFLYFGVGILTSILFLGILSFKLKEKIIDKVEYDNLNIYKTPFHINYLKSSFKELKYVKNMVTISILFALMMCSKFISVPSGFSNLGIGIGYLIFSVIAMLYGPLAGMIIGVLSDNIGFLIKPSGLYFPGYTISAMIAGLIYALCLYKTKITFMKCLFSRMIVNFLVNTLLGTYWWWLINDKTISFKAYLLTAELPKNLVYLIPQSVLMFILLKALSKPLKGIGILNEQIADNITIL